MEKIQFLISKDKIPVPSGWVKINLNGVTLHYHKNLKAINISVPDKKPIGLILGHFKQVNNVTNINLDNQIFCLDKSVSDKEEEIIKQINLKFFGRYIFILSMNKKERLYLDPLGSLGCVYSEELKSAASIAGILGKNKFDEDWDFDLTTLIPSNFFPFGLTPHKSIKRLLPNHYLDLNNWTSNRHFPAKNDLNNNLTDNKRVVEISKAMKSVISLYSKTHAGMTLTAGSDNRIMLACTKDFIRDFTFFTNQNSLPYDIEISKNISNDFNLKHHFIPFKKSSIDERKLLEELSGYCMESSSLDSYPMHKSLLKDTVYQLTGTGGEIGRCFYWYPMDRKNDVLKPEEILRRLKMPANSELINSAAVWINELKDINIFNILDLLFWEINCGCRSAPNMYPYDNLSMIPIHPFNDIRILKHLLNLTPEYKKSRSLVSDICRMNWPELNTYPINRRTGFNGLIDLTKESAKNLLRPILSTYLTKKIKQ